MNSNIRNRLLAIARSNANQYLKGNALIGGYTMKHGRKPETIYGRYRNIMWKTIYNRELKKLGKNELTCHARVNAIKKLATLWKKVKSERGKNYNSVLEDMQSEPKYTKGFILDEDEVKRRRTFQRDAGVRGTRIKRHPLYGAIRMDQFNRKEREIVKRGIERLKLDLPLTKKQTELISLYDVNRQ